VGQPPFRQTDPPNSRGFSRSLQAHRACHPAYAPAIQPKTSDDDSFLVAQRNFEVAQCRSVSQRSVWISHIFAIHSSLCTTLLYLCRRRCDKHTALQIRTVLTSTRGQQLRLEGRSEAQGRRRGRAARPSRGSRSRALGRSHLGHPLPLCTWLHDRSRVCEVSHAAVSPSAATRAVAVLEHPQRRHLGGSGVCELRGGPSLRPKMAPTLPGAVSSRPMSRRVRGVRDSRARRRGGGGALCRWGRGLRPGGHGQRRRRRGAREEVPHPGRRAHTSEPLYNGRRAHTTAPRSPALTPRRALLGLGARKPRTRGCVHTSKRLC
jgi:hypothetical protein